MSYWEGTVKWRAWPEWCEPSGTPRESYAALNMPTGGELAATVVWQLEVNGESFEEDEMVVEIMEPTEFAGRYLVEIEHSCTTRGRELEVT